MENLWITFAAFWPTLFDGLVDTMYMTFASVTIAYALGLPMGVMLVATGPDGLMPNRPANKILGMVVNTGRSIPFIILIVLLIPITRIIVGTTIGSTAAIVPLVIAAAPFVARMVEAALSELDAGVIDAAKSMGAGNFQIIRKVMLPESIPSLVRGLAITTINLISLSAMAGAVGAGGLGRIAIRYGYQRFQTDLMLITVVFIVAIVAIVQLVLNVLAAKIDRKII
ncbi:MAG: ABC transporter permease [Defluviitaleaceae bacterium]|nr:ABC transporter permease [Defluviitaleaceae bacterium]